MESLPYAGSQGEAHDVDVALWGDVIQTSHSSRAKPTRTRRSSMDLFYGNSQGMTSAHNAHSRRRASFDGTRCSKSDSSLGSPREAANEVAPRGSSPKSGCHWSRTTSRQSGCRVELTEDVAEYYRSARPVRRSMDSAQPGHTHATLHHLEGASQRALTHRTLAADASRHSTSVPASAASTGPSAAQCSSQRLGLLGFSAGAERGQGACGEGSCSEAIETSEAADAEKFLHGSRNAVGNQQFVPGLAS